MKKILSFFGFLLIIGIASQASAITITNGSFEGSLDGWNPSGTAFIATIAWDADYDVNNPDTDDVYGPTDGYYMAELSGNGASIFQYTSWSAGEMISFDWNYLNFDGFQIDYGFFEIFDGNSIIDTITISAASTDSTGWKTVNYEFSDPSTAGSYIKFGLNTTLTYNSDFDENQAPILLIDNVVAPVPEPATMMLFGIGLLGLAGVTRRKRA